MIMAITRGRKREPKYLKYIDAMDVEQVVAFMRLMTVSDYGTHFYFKADKNADELIPQTQVEELAVQLGINYALVDAEERLLECENGKKKYIPAHQEYLQAIRDGQTAAKPKIYEVGKPKPKAKAKGKDEDVAPEPETETVAS